VVGEKASSRNWEVKISSVETVATIGTIRPVSTIAHFAVLTLEITYVGPEKKGSYSPLALVLVNVDVDNTGWANNTNLFRQEGNSRYVDVRNTPVVRFVNQGETVVETFAFVFLRAATKAVLYFPEAEGIYLELEASAPAALPTVRPRPTRAATSTRLPSATPTPAGTRTSALGIPRT
jgi:hypothetical protein